MSGALMATGHVATVSKAVCLQQWRGGRGFLPAALAVQLMLECLAALGLIAMVAH